MSKLSTFIYMLKNTFLNPHYYADIFEANFETSMKYFVLFFFIYALIGTVYVSSQILYPAQLYMHSLLPEIASIYPDELQIDIKDGVAHTNVPEPYYIPVSRIEDAFKKANKDVLGDKTDKLKYALVIDTNANIEDFESYNTYALLTKNHITYLNKDKIESQPLTKFKNVTINKALVNKLQGFIRPFFGLILPIGTAFILSAMLIFVPVGYLVYNLFLALVLMFISKWMSYPLTYGKSYQMGLHLITISATIFGVMTLLNISIHFPFLQTALLGIFAIIIFNNLKTETTKRAS